MESHVMFLCIFLLAGIDWIEAARIKRQDFQDYPDYQDFGLAFVTVHSKPISSEQVSSNQFPGSGFQSNNNNNNFQSSSFQSSSFNRDSPPPPPPRKQESRIPGVGGVDYPMYHKVPPTNFRCSDTPAIPGMYANVETGCQAYHVCHDGRDGPQGTAFLCTNGTLFNQKEFICDWWYNVDCGLSLLYYGLNLDPLKNPYTKREREEELRKIQEFNQFNQQEK